MDIPSATTPSSSGDNRKSGSFAETLRKEGPDKARPPLAMASFKSSQAVNLAAGLGSMSPNFMPAMGEGMLDAMGLAEGANDAMRQYEEEASHRFEEEMNHR